MISELRKYTPEPNEKYLFKELSLLCHEKLDYIEKETRRREFQEKLDQLISSKDGNDKLVLSTVKFLSESPWRKPFPLQFGFDRDMVAAMLCGYFEGEIHLIIADFATSVITIDIKGKRTTYFDSYNTERVNKKLSKRNKREAHKRVLEVFPILEIARVSNWMQELGLGSFHEIIV